MEDTSIVNKTEPTQLAALLQEYEPGFLPEPLFVAIARLVVLTAVEFIPLRKSQDGGVEVLLFKRPDTDPIWPNMLHTPGTMLRSTDDSFKDGFDRLFNDELKIPYPSEPVFVGTDLVHHKRGTIVTLEYIVAIDQKTVGGEFYNVNDLPGSFIPEQIEMIKRAAARFIGL